MTSRANPARAWLIAAAALAGSLALSACSSSGSLSLSRSNNLYEDDGSGVKPRVRIARYVGDAIEGVFTIAGTLVMAIIPEAVESPDIDLAGYGLHPRVISDQPRLQCVPYARERSGIEIYGDAWRWWDMERDTYPRDARPAATAVLVLKGYRGQRRGHVAVVTRVIDSRTIVIDHANWLNDEKIYLDQPVIDVSANNDWSEVRVWHTPTQRYGARRYKTRGFIYPDMQVAALARSGNPVALASADAPAASSDPAALELADNIILPRMKPVDVGVGIAAMREPELIEPELRETEVAARTPEPDAVPNAVPEGGWAIPVPKPVIVGAGAMSLSQ